MKTRHIIMSLASAAFVAATLQGSRLPEEIVKPGPIVAQAGSVVEYRAGSGADKDEYPPLSDGVFA